MSGSGFLPGASLIWNGVSHDTTYMDSLTLNVAVGASEVNTAARVSVTCRNPGSTDSNAVSITIRRSSIHTARGFRVKGLPVYLEGEAERVVFPRKRPAMLSPLHDYGQFALKTWFLDSFYWCPVAGY